MCHATRGTLALLLYLTALERQTFNNLTVFGSAVSHEILGTIEPQNIQVISDNSHTGHYFPESLESYLLKR